MYSLEERMRAINRYIENNLSEAKTIRELGYPRKSVLPKWYKRYIESLDGETAQDGRRLYTDAQIKAAVEFCMAHGKDVKLTIETLGYPVASTLYGWIKQLHPYLNNEEAEADNVVHWTEVQKIDAVIQLCTRTVTAEVLAKQLGVPSRTLYNWRRSFLKGEYNGEMAKKRQSDPSRDPKELIEQIQALQEELARSKELLYWSNIQLDAVQEAIKVTKKEAGFDLTLLTNREKTQIVEALKNRYKQKDLLKQLKLAKSSFKHWQKKLRQGDPYAAIRLLMVEIFQANYQGYGYRRIHAALKARGIVISEKIVRRLMKEENLVVRRKKPRRYNSYAGEITPPVQNRIKRKFQAKAPNRKWLTDITEFRIPACKVYLSPIIDCFDGLVVSWSIGTSPDAELVNTMLDKAMATVTKRQRTIIHSDRGVHYRWPEWIERTEKYNLKRSMSRKGCTGDNAACEGFFGRLKNECFYQRDFSEYSIDEFIAYLEDYIFWYNNHRVKKSLGYLSPVAYRKRLSIAV